MHTSDTGDSQDPVYTPKRLFNRDFVLLWQGALVSMFGDLLFEIALGFWILAETGSTGLMGTLMAVSIIPRVVISPVAGVIADRYDRKRLLVSMDAVRGVCVVAVGIAAILGVLEIWMVFLTGIVLGTCAAFFDPAAGSMLPDVVPKASLQRANSLFAMLHSGIRILGNSAGGFFYVSLGAPLMFLANGISYLFSSVTEMFIRKPAPVRSDAEHTPFLEDMKSGYRYVWQRPGLRVLMIVGAVLNFFASAAMILLLPLFQRTAELGPVRYGIFMAVSAAGSLVGLILVSIYKIAPAARRRWFLGSLISFTFLYALIPLLRIFPLMLAVTLIAHILNAIVNILLQTVIQSTTARSMRGKVFSLLSMLLTGLMPVAMATGGWLGELFPLQYVICICMICCGIPGLFLLPNKEFTAFITSDSGDGEPLEAEIVPEIREYDATLDRP